MPNTKSRQYNVGGWGKFIVGGGGGGGLRPFGPAVI